MSASNVRIPDGREEEYERALDTIRTASVGEEVLFNDRKSPLVVTETDDEDPQRYITVEGPNGAVYDITSDRTGGILSFKTGTGRSVENLRIVDTDPTDRLPDWNTAAAAEAAAAETNGSGDDDEPPEIGGLDGVRIDLMDGDLIASGRHGEFDADFDITFHWDEDGDGWRYDESDSTIGGDLGMSGRAQVLHDVEAAIDMDGYDVVRTIKAGDLDDEDPSPVPSDTNRWPSAGEDAEESDADSWLARISGNPSVDWTRFIQNIDSPESAAGPDSIIDRFFGDDRQSTWTFVDELLAFNEDVPRAVNNWRLIDYGIVTDQSIDDTRKCAWYDIDDDELLALAVVNDGDGPRWLVYHTDAPDEMPESDRSPVTDTRDADEALDMVRDMLYPDGGSVDMSVQEDPETGEVTIFDAISNTELYQRIASLPGADPFGLRSYVRNTSFPEFVMDVDGVLFDTLAKARGGAEALSSGVRSLFGRQNRATFGYALKLTIVQNLAAVSERISTLRASPVIDYGALGLQVDYKYSTGRNRSERRVFDFTVSPAVAFPKVNLGVAFAYVGLVESSRVQRLTNFTFDLPSVTFEGDVEPERDDDGNLVGSTIDWGISIGSVQTRVDTSASSRSSSSPSGTASSNAGVMPSRRRPSSSSRKSSSGDSTPAPSSIDAMALTDDSNLEKVMSAYEGNEAALIYFSLLAMAGRVSDEHGELDNDNAAAQIGNVWADVRSVAGEYGVSKSDVKGVGNSSGYNVVKDVNASVAVGGLDFISALDDALDNVSADEVARSSDLSLDSGVTAGSGEESDSGDSDASDATPSGGDGQGFLDESVSVEEGDDSVSPREIRLAEKISEALDAGETSIDDLSGGERELLQKVQRSGAVENDIISEEERELLGVITGKETKQQAEEDGLLDDTAEAIQDDAQEEHTRAMYGTRDPEEWSEYMTNPGDRDNWA